MTFTAAIQKPENILEGDVDEVVRAVSGASQSGPHFILITMPDKSSAMGYAEILRDIAELLPPALENVRTLRIQQVVEALSGIMMPGLPSAALAEARMMADARAQVLTSGQFVTAEEISRLVGYSKSNPSSQPTRWKQDGQIFAVNQKGTNYFPLFALNPDKGFRPYKEVREIISIFRESQLSDWAIGAWFLGVNSFLDDRTPKDLLATNPSLVVEAARDAVSAVSHG